MKTFQDFLTWNNNLDVGPFVEAAQKLQEFYFSKNIDPFKVGISLPSISRILLFQSANANFPLFNSASQDIYKTIKRNIYGGPSIIFTRHLKSDETHLRGNPNKLCQNVLGKDAYALYVHALSQNFPTGCLTDRKVPNFKAEPNVKFMSMYSWSDYMKQKDNCYIIHRLNNNNKEVYINHIPVDGFCSNTRTVYEFNGCYFHGHECNLTKHCNEKWRERKTELEERTKAEKNNRSSRKTIKKFNICVSCVICEIF